jgi:hypothetical protein
MANGESQQVPLVIGVTGHRDAICGEQNALRNAVREVLRDVRQQCPQTPITILSALAEGADRLVASIACDEFGAELIAPLPFPAHFYEQDFPDPQSREQFRSLLRRARYSFAVPMQAGNDERNVGESERRSVQYEAVGKYIAAHSLVLIALWNGVNTMERGGTWQVVRFQLGEDEASAALGSLDAPKRGPVYHIVTPRSKTPEVVGEPYKWRIRYPPGSQPAQQGDHAHRLDEHTGLYKAILGRIDTLNVDISRFQSEEAALKRANSPLQRTRQWILQSESDTLPASSQSLLDRYDTMNALAIEYAAITRTSFRVLFGLALAAIAFFEAWAHLLKQLEEKYEAGPAVLALFLLYPFIWLIAYLVWKRAHNRDYQSKFQDYRALAEALRVQVVWDIVGLTDAVEDSYLRKQRGELEWIRCALATWKWQQRKEGQADPIQRVHHEHLPLIRRVWIEGQRDFFKKAARRERKRSRSYRSRGQSRFLVSMGIAVVLGAWLLARCFAPLKEPGLTVDVALTAIGIFTVWAAMPIALGEKMAFAEHANQYRTMHNLFSYAARRFESATKKDEDCIPFIRELGREALSENGDWLLMHRERQLEVPIP